MIRDESRRQPASRRGLAPRTVCVRQNLVIQAERTYRADGKAAPIDKQWIFVVAMRSPAILHDAHTTRRNLILHAVIEQDHAIGYILLMPLRRQRSVTSFSRDDRGHPLVLEPVEETPYFGTKTICSRMPKTGFRWCPERHADTLEPQEIHTPIEIGAVGWQEQYPGAAGLDRGFGLEALVGGEVVEHDDVASRKMSARAGFRQRPR